MIQTFPKTAMLPSDIERQKIFYWIKKVSSVTAWTRIFNYYQIWAEITENSLRLADSKGWGDNTALSPSRYASILNGLAHCEEGVVRLRKGDKRVFKFDANGEFEVASRALFHWKKLINRIEEGENGIDEEHTPLWREFCTAANDIYQAWEECSIGILESRYLDEPAGLVYGDWLRDELANEYEPAALENLPALTEEIFVPTNDYIPFSGIWEPIQVPTRKSSLLSLLRRKEIPQPPFQIAGAMNYLHGGSKAPEVQVETSSDFIAMNTTWRLLWRDDRYMDCSIPAEESHYRFRQPEKIATENTVGKQLDHTLWAESGAAVPASGKWLVETDLAMSLQLSAGESFPQHKGRDVRWVLADR